jgi:AcrR family transcriptional regulator
MHDERPSGVTELAPAAHDRGGKRATGPASGSGTPRTDTRSRAQKVALELFAEQGYEKTSLREIAERLGVTKAALYYHFKSKEDIVHSFTDDYFEEIDQLLDWAKDQPMTKATRRELLDRYVGIVLAGSEVFRFLEQNRAAVQGMEAGKERFARFRDRLDSLTGILAGPDAPLRGRVRATTAVLAVSATCLLYLDQIDDPDKLRAIVLEIATDLIHLAAGGQSRRAVCADSSRASSRLCREARVFGSSAPSSSSHAATFCSNRGMASAGRPVAR